MIENDKSSTDKSTDEYQFLDLESATPDFESELRSSKKDKQAWMHALTGSLSGQKNVKRNALLVIVMVMLLMVVYRWVNYSSPSTDKKSQVAIAPVSMTVSKKQSTSTPIKRTLPSTTTSESSVVAAPRVAVDVDQKLSTLTHEQQAIRAALTQTEAQLAVLSANMGELTTKMAALNQAMSVLTTNMESQSREMAQWLAQRKPIKPPSTVWKREHPSHHAPPSLQYAIQAVIPGRAWLIASNGTTLTVREGSLLSGYGVVKWIDAEQGRVIMGSGRVIRFAQEDS